MRDPSALGRFLLDMDASPGKEARMTALEVYDKIAILPTITIPNYDPGESTVTETARAYREELEARAAEGDKFAISMLTTGQPGDSDE